LNANVPDEDVFQKGVKSSKLDIHVFINVVSP